MEKKQHNSRRVADGPAEVWTVPLRLRWPEIKSNSGLLFSGSLLSVTNTIVLNRWKNLFLLVDATHQGSKNLHCGGEEPLWRCEQVVWKAPDLHHVVTPGLPTAPLPCFFSFFHFQSVTCETSISEWRNAGFPGNALIPSVLLTEHHTQKPSDKSCWNRIGGILFRLLSMMWNTNLSALLPSSCTSFPRSASSSNPSSTHISSS